MSKRMRIDGLDLLKTLAIVMVVSVHIPLLSTDYYAADGGFIQVIEYAVRLITEGVPIFLMVNGFLILGRENLNIKEHYRKTARIFLIMLFWMMFYITAFMIMQRRIWSPERVLNTIFSTAAGSDSTGLLWFLQGLIAVYIVYPILNSAYRNNYQAFQAVFLSLYGFRILHNGIGAAHDIVLAAGHDASLLANASTWLDKFQIVLILPGKSDYLLYFMLGGMLLHYIDYIAKHKNTFIIAGFVTWAIALIYGLLRGLQTHATFSPGFNYESIFMPVLLASALALSLKYVSNGKLWNRWIRNIGENTLGIYLVHYALIGLCKYAFDINGLVSKILCLFGVFLASWGLVLLMKKIPGVRAVVTL